MTVTGNGSTTATVSIQGAVNVPVLQTIQLMPVTSTTLPGDGDFDQCELQQRHDVRYMPAGRSCAVHGDVAGDRRSASPLSSAGNQFVAGQAVVEGVIFPSSPADGICDPIGLSRRDGRSSQMARGKRR